MLTQLVSMNQIRQVEITESRSQGDKESVFVQEVKQLYTMTRVDQVNIKVIKGKTE